MKATFTLLCALVLSIASLSAQESPFTYTELSGIGYEPQTSRRDPSDVIKVGDTYYVYYTKHYGEFTGKWTGPFTVWAAKSTDGYNWTEIGEVLGMGQEGAFDSASVFTPNIIYAKKEKKYYLYYTGFMPTPGDPSKIGAKYYNKYDKDDFASTLLLDYICIGVASSDSPEGPFVRVSDEPVLRPSVNLNAFDSYRVDDAVLFYKDKKYWFYYKGRSYADGQTGNKKTHMGVAFADSPEGPYIKYGEPLLYRSHESMVWQDGDKVYAYATLDATIESSDDGLNFSNPIKVTDAPKAPGAFREDLTNPKKLGKTKLEWGVAMVFNNAECYIVRYDYDATKLK